MSNSRNHNMLRLLAWVGVLTWTGVILPRLTAQEAGSEGAGVEKPSTSDEVPKHAIRTKADSLDFDKESGNVVLRGHVVITRDDAQLLADVAQYNEKTRQAHAEGHVRLRKGFKEWVSDSLDYNFETGAMKAGLARADLGNGVFAQAKSLESADLKRFVLKDSYFTTSDYERPGFRMKASEIIFYPNDRIAMHNLVVYAGPIPVFYFPYFVMPLDDNDTDGFNTGTQVQIGSKSRWGFFILNSYTTRLSEDLRPTFRLDYRTDRGVAGGIDLRYKAGEKRDPDLAPDEWQPRVSGKIRTYYADDDKVRRGATQQQVVTTTGIANEVIHPERYQVRVSQRADLTEEMYSKLKLNKVSDGNFLEDYFEKEFQSDPQPDNFFEFTKWSPNATLSLLARPQFNNFYTTTERLPELRYDLKRQSVLNSPVFYESENSVSYLAKENSSLFPSPDYHSKRVDTFHQFLYPKQYFEWLNFTPRVGGRATFYDHTPITPNQPSIVRTVFNTGFEAGFKASRVWSNAHDKRMEIDGLRHIIEPSINYAFVGRPSEGPSRIYQFDTDRSSFGLQRDLTPIDFPQYTGIDSINKMNVFRPTLRQRLQTKRDGQPWDLAALTLYQDMRVDKVAGQRSFSDFFSELSIKPTRWLSLDWNARWDVNDDQLRASDTYLTVFRKKSWKLSLSNNYFRGVGDQIGVNWDWSVNEDWTLRTNHRFDPDNGGMVEQSYAIDRDLHSWIATFSLSELSPLNRDRDFRVWLSFTLKAFPEVSFDSSQVGSGNGGN